MVAHRNYASFVASKATAIAITAVASAVASAESPVTTAKPRAKRAAKVPRSPLTSVPLPKAASASSATRGAVPATQLRAALQRLCAVADSASSLPILEHVALRSTGDMLVLRTTDLDMSLTIRLPLIAPTWGMTLPAKPLLELVRIMPSDVSIARTERGARLTSDSVTLDMVGMSEADYPKIPEVGDAPMATIDAQVLVEMIESTLYSVCLDSTRFHLNGALVECDGDQTTLVTTDGHRLTKVTRTLAMRLPKHMIIPAKGLRELSRALQSGDCQIGATATHLFVRQGNCEVAIRAIDANFPPYEQVIPVNPHTITVDRVKLIAAAKRAAKILGNQETVPMCLGIDEDTKELMLSSTHPDIGTMVDRVACHPSHTAIRIALRPRYLIESLGTFTDERVTLAIGDELAPVVVREASDVLPLASSSHVAVIMPMRR